MNTSKKTVSLLIMLLIAFSTMAAADPAGVCWIADMTGGALIKLAPDGITELSRIQNFDNPWRVSVNPTDGSCWMINYYGELTKFSVTGSVLFQITGLGREGDVSVNPNDGSCWVSTGRNGQLIKYSASGVEQFRIGTLNVNFFASIAVDPTDNSCWVGDFRKREVSKISSVGTILFTSSGFQSPAAIAVNPTNGDCWVGDWRLHRIVKFRSNGVVLGNYTNVDYPYSASVNPNDGSLWVTDSNKHQVVKLDVNGNEIARVGVSGWPMSVKVDRNDGSCWVAAGSQSVIKLNSSGTPIAQFNNVSDPASLAVNPAAIANAPPVPADITVFKSAWPACSRPGTSLTYVVTIRNIGNKKAKNVTFVDYLPAEMTYVSSSPAYTYNAATHSVSGSVGDLDGLGSALIYISGNVPASTPLGTVLVNQADVSTPTLSDDTSNNSVINQRTVVGSFDPNMKEVSPRGYITSNQWLMYTIYFENKGTAEAIDIKITDVLDRDLDSGNMQFISDKGHYNSTSRTITWELKDINLPPGGQGSVSFIIKPLAGLAPGVAIKNRASIIFDHNPAIVTNDVVNVIGYPEELALQDIIKTLYSLRRDIKLLHLTNQQGFLAKIDAAIAKVSEGLAALHIDNVDLTFNHLNTAKNQLQSLSNLIRAQNTRNLPQPKAAALTAKTVSIINAINTAVGLIDDAYPVDTP